MLGLATAATLVRGMYLMARILVVAETVCILAAWAVAQWPYLIVPDVTIDNAASPASVLRPMLIVVVVGMALVLPGLWYLLHLQDTTANARPGNTVGILRRHDGSGPVADAPLTPNSTATSLIAGDGGPLELRTAAPTLSVAGGGSGAGIHCLYRSGGRGDNNLP